jgi:hypothetical protein
MNKEQKRKLRNISLLALAGLIGGTFAFTAFNQQAINDRENEVQVNVGGRVHDYYDVETENKDVFVENYGERPIMARIRLSEYLETQQTGASAPTPLVDGTERDQLNTWTPYIPSATAIGTRTGAGAAFNRYSNLRFGRAGEAPWYLPTFNHNNLDLSTAAAGDARDYIADGATRDTAQNLQQERAPMTIEQWFNLPNNQKIGDFWVIAHNTGWAYWASMLEPEEATSYLLDAAEMTSAIEDTVFNGTYYYGIHVDSQLISPDNSEEFTNDGEAHDSNLDYFLEGIKNNAGDDDFGNPAYNENSAPSEFTFHLMNPGRIFTMAGEQYRYLENMGGGNHMIIRNNTILNRSWNELDEALSTWYGDLDPAVQAMVQPVANEFTPGMISVADAGRDGQGFNVTNLASNPEVYNDVTQVSQGANSSPQAFALSLADVNRLSGPGLGFPNLAQRIDVNGVWWWTRTPDSEITAWAVLGGSPIGQLNHNIRTANNTFGGFRPALIINQATN